ncbi:MAG: CsgG/HfaB family protein [Treponema sp.]|jgi:hypothetical protein|nr:CsgG/HfaB family protein [Treponema sp.]
MNKIVVGLLFVSSVIGCFAQEQKKDLLLEQITNVIAAKGFITLAVLDFVNGDDGSVSELGQQFMDESIKYLVTMNPKIRVVERERLDSVLDELALYDSGYMSEKNSLGLGELLGADAIVTGTLTLVKGTTISVTTRIIDLRTGVVLSSGVSIIKGNRYRRLYGQIIKEKK